MLIQLVLYWQRQQSAQDALERTANTAGASEKKLEASPRYLKPTPLACNLQQVQLPKTLKGEIKSFKQLLAFQVCMCLCNAVVRDASRKLNASTTLMALVKVSFYWLLKLIDGISWHLKRIN